MIVALSLAFPSVSITLLATLGKPAWLIRWLNELLFADISCGYVAFMTQRLFLVNFNSVRVR